jgi:3-hydroxyisobutyrate dehydrogenase
LTIVLAGGAADDVAQAQPVFEALARRVTHLGPSGAGQMAKSCNQMIVGCNVLMIAEMLAAARRAGVEVEKLPGALAGGFADSLPLQLFGPRMAAGEFTPPLGSVRAMLKDLDQAAALARASGSAAPLTALSAELYRSLGKRADLGGLDADICRMIEIFE